MDNIKIFENEEFGDIKAIEKQTPTYFGYVYILEYGNALKIGQSKLPHQRIQALKRQGEKYADKKIGRVALSPKCTNYPELEKQFHQIFAKYRKEGTELFDLIFEDAVSEINNQNIEYRDDSQEMEHQAENFFQSMKRFTLGGVL